jgi:hypothetical protein
MFVYPVGPGLSRATKPEYVKYLVIEVGGVMAETEFIRYRLLLHNADETNFPPPNPLPRAEFR